MAIKEGDEVEVEYTGSFDDGTVFDSSSGREPLKFSVGEGMVIPGFDNAVLELKVGDEKKIKIEPKDAYGEVNPALTKKVPMENLPKGQKPEVGMTLILQAPTGQKIPARISELNNKEVTIDLNHPLAGKRLNFKIKILNVNTGEKQYL